MIQGVILYAGRDNRKTGDKLETFYQDLVAITPWGSPPLERRDLPQNQRSAKEQASLAEKGNGTWNKVNARNMYLQ